MNATEGGTGVSSFSCNIPLKDLNPVHATKQNYNFRFLSIIAINNCTAIFVFK